MAGFSRIELVDIAVQLEECGKAFYDEAVEVVRSPTLKAALAHLSAEEARHAASFEGLLGDLAESAAEWRHDEAYAAYVRTVVERRVFPDPEAARKAVRGLASEADIVRMALQFEHAAVAFFTGMRPFVREEDRPLVDRLVAEEEGHVRVLEMLGSGKI